jgi:hypothetical protein
MPVTPHEQEVLDRITANLHAQGVVQELPLDERSLDTYALDMILHLMDTWEGLRCGDHLGELLSDIADILRHTERHPQKF